MIYKIYILKQYNKICIKYNKMALSSKATLQFQNKLIKNILLSILVPSFIIMVSAWYFFGDRYTSTTPSTTTTTTASTTTTNLPTDENKCAATTEQTCDKSMCSWDPTAKRPGSSEIGLCSLLNK
jgi:hypothetical protein